MSAICSRRLHLPADQAETQLVIALQQARRVDQVGAPHRVQNVGDGDAGGQQFRGIRHDVELRLLPALHDHGGDAVQAVQRGFISYVAISHSSVCGIVSEVRL